MTGKRGIRASCCTYRVNGEHIHMYVALLLLKSEPTVPSFLYHSFSRLGWVWVWFLVESCSSSSGELRSDIRQRCWSLRSLPRLKEAIAVIDEIDSSVLMATIAEQSGGGTTMLEDYVCELSYACKLHVENSRSSSNGPMAKIPVLRGSFPLLLFFLLVWFSAWSLAGLICLGLKDQQRSAACLNCWTLASICCARSAQQL